MLVTIIYGALENPSTPYQSMPSKTASGSRTKTTPNEEQCFKDAFAQVLRGKLTADQQLGPEPTDSELCEVYESLPRAIKRGTWPGVRNIMAIHRFNKSKTWPAKHYINAFSKARYPNSLNSLQKHRINARIADMLGRQCSRKEIASSILFDFKDDAIFPGSIQSYIYQECNRQERGPHRRNEEYDSVSEGSNNS